MQYIGVQGQFGLTKYAVVTAYIQTETNLVDPGAYPDLVSPPSFFDIAGLAGSRQLIVP